MWEKHRYNPHTWETDLLVAILVRAVRDCVTLDSSSFVAHEAYDFLMDDSPWELIGVSCNCKDAIRGVVKDPAGKPNEGGYIQGVLGGLKDIL